MKQYDKIPIVDAARRCGVALASRTLKHREVEATCPFCHDHGPGFYARMDALMPDWRRRRKALKCYSGALERE